MLTIKLVSAAPKPAAFAIKIGGVITPTNIASICCRPSKNLLPIGG